MLKSGRICKNNDHTCLFHCINTYGVPRTMIEHEAEWPSVQTASSGPGQFGLVLKHRLRDPANVKGNGNPDDYYVLYERS